MSKKKIDYRFRFMYAIGIIMVVLGHCGDGGISLFTEWFPATSFHMPLFVFCAGYFLMRIIQKM